MVAASNYLSNATKQQTQAHIDAVSSLLEHALHSVGEVTELGLAAAKESLNDSFAKFNEVIDSKDAAKVFEALTLEVQPTTEKVSAYAKHFVEIGTNAQSEVVKLIQERLHETVGHVNTLIDDLAKAAPAGSEPFAEMVKLQAANFHKAYEQFSSASHDLLGTYQSQLHNFASHFANSAPTKPVKVKKLAVAKSK